MTAAEGQECRGVFPPRNAHPGIRVAAGVEIGLHVATWVFNNSIETGDPTDCKSSGEGDWQQGKKGLVFLGRHLGTANVQA